ncbi:MAG: hypothetical protein AB1599_07715 [Planctomycetota bacterium]
MTDKGCKKCGKRIPVRNKQANFACQRECLCRECYEQADGAAGNPAPAPNGWVRKVGLYEDKNE